MHEFNYVIAAPFRGQEPPPKGNSPAIRVYPLHGQVDHRGTMEDAKTALTVVRARIADEIATGHQRNEIYPLPEDYAIYELVCVRRSPVDKL